MDLFVLRIYPSRNRIHDMEILKKNNIKNFQFANSEFEPEFMKLDINDFVEENEMCRWSVDSINIDADKIVEIRGWAYVIGENNQFNKYKLIAKNDKELYISTLKNGNRADLIDAFPNEINLFHAGFMGWNKDYIADIDSGDYDLFLGIENTSGKYMCPLQKKIHVP
ncbi:hypothetical protein [Selenomonas ruminantium]|uniref:hypothetical protein n=1 Tax=Selenomonas ruminantium TaxID=971 RepID=UPI00047EC9E7|nr:hypothetical protein [Selenomonas ruminantium]